LALRRLSYRPLPRIKSRGGQSRNLGGGNVRLGRAPLVAATIALVTAADLLSLGPPQMPLPLPKILIAVLFRHPNGFRQCPLSALSGHPTVAQPRSLLGVKRTSGGGASMSAYGPRTLGTSLLLWAHPPRPSKRCRLCRSPKERQDYGENVPRCSHRSNDSKRRKSNEPRY
jgi:hypothetical protein